MSKKNICLLLGAVCLILTYAISIQLNTIKNTNNTVSQSLKENSLRDEVLKWKEKYDNAFEQLQKNEKELEEKRQQVASKSVVSEARETEIKVGNNILGLTEVTGKGVIITLSDNNTGVLDVLTPIENTLIHDEDIRVVINELKNAGAEAISVNDQRIVNTTAINCDGNVVRINGEKIGSPYTIKAIGLPESIYTSLTRRGGPIQVLNSTGAIAEIKKSNSITIPKYTGVLNNKYIEIVK